MARVEKPKIDWTVVFALRCRSKRGTQLTPAEQATIAAAYRADKRRYGAMERDVFEATKPFGAR